MFMLRHAGRASRNLIDIGFPLGFIPSRPRALQSSLRSIPITHLGTDKLYTTACFEQRHQSNVSQTPRSAQSSVEILLHPFKVSAIARHLIHPAHNIPDNGIAVQHRLHKSFQPPPFPQPPQLPSKHADEVQVTEQDEGDHAELARQLKDNHGAADTDLPSNGFDPLNASGKHSRENVLQAASLLKHVGVAQLREELEAISEQQATMPYNELLKLIKNSNVAGSTPEAQRVADALCSAGFVLRFRSQVYLRPDEVAHGMLSALPDTINDLEAKANQLEADLEPLRKLKHRVDQSAHWRSKAVMWSGFFLLMGQFCTFYWLTWYELSWDVMEPVAYFVSLGTAISFYLFFLLTNEPFDYRPFQQKLFAGWQQKHFSKTNFDQRAYDRLQADLSRYRRYITHFKKQ